VSRVATSSRKTLETDITVRIDLDGSGTADIATGVGFYDHLLTALAHHGMFDLTVAATGDLHIDEHHTVEDTALVLGTVFAEALGDRTGLVRYGDSVVPMDEARATAAVDVASGRSYCVVDLELRTERIGGLGTQMLPHLLEAFARTSGFTIHVAATGRNDHHVAESAFKALARALRTAVEIDPRRSGIASTKGVPEERTASGDAT
jgi:imidazoleglycerol-phosphate dehydratase